MSAARKQSRFSYLSAAESAPEQASREQEPDQDAEIATQTGGDDTGRTEARRGGGEGASLTRQDRKSSSRKSATEELTSVPKGKGRMKQERSQLNVRVPTVLKRRASAKAMLEGKDIGAVVEELLREYLDRKS